MAQTDLVCSECVGRRTVNNILMKVNSKVMVTTVPPDHPLAYTRRPIFVSASVHIPERKAHWTKVLNMSLYFQSTFQWSQFRWNPRQKSDDLSFSVKLGANKKNDTAAKNTIFKMADVIHIITEAINRICKRNRMKAPNMLPKTSKNRSWIISEKKLKNTWL
jgi:hypothetical protein